MRLSRRKSAADAASDLAVSRPVIGGVAQLGERLLCKQEVIGSIPFTSTTMLGAHRGELSALSCQLSA